MMSLTRRFLLVSTMVAVVATAIFGSAMNALAAARSPKKWGLTDQKRQALREMQENFDYPAILQAYADFMIEYGRDRYAKEHSPLFACMMDRKTGSIVTTGSLKYLHVVGRYRGMPTPHLKRKPFAPWLERDRECRTGDRNVRPGCKTGADPLDHLAFFKLLYQLSKATGDEKYRREADAALNWWLDHTQSRNTGLYPWGSHIFWDFNSERAQLFYGQMEFNRPWPYWHLNPDALQRFARGLWDHAIADKETGNFSRHVKYDRHGPGKDMEFPWPGASFLYTWTQAYLDNPDPEYKRAIRTILERWQSLRDPETGRLAPCTKYQDWVWLGGYLYAANLLDDAAVMMAPKDAELAEMMRDYGRKNDKDFLSRADERLDIKHVGPVMSYKRETGDYPKDRPDVIGAPWMDRKHFARHALPMYGRSQRTDNEQFRARYRQAVLDTAELYMSLNPEIGWPVWGCTMSDVLNVLFAAQDITGNPAYLHRAEQFARLSVELFLDDTSPLPKVTSMNHWYECLRVTGRSPNAWMNDLMELQRRLTTVEGPGLVEVAGAKGTLDAGADGAWRQKWEKAVEANQAAVWDCTTLKEPAANVAVVYDTEDGRVLDLSRRTEAFRPDGDNGIPAADLELIASDVVNRIPTWEEAGPFISDAWRRNFGPSDSRYGGFKDVMRQAGLVIANRGDKATTVQVKAILHDTFYDKGELSAKKTIPPGGTAFVGFEAPEQHWIRRVDVKASSDAVRLRQFAFAMAPRSRLNPPAPKPFEGAEPKLIEDGLVLHLSGDALAHLEARAAVEQWPSRADQGLLAVAEDDTRPTVVRDGDRTLVRFDGNDDFLTIADSKVLDLKAWTIFAVTRPASGPGVVIGKIDERNQMMNYRLQINGRRGISAVARGVSAGNQAGRVAPMKSKNHLSVVAAVFNPEEAGADKIEMILDGEPVVNYSYQDARGSVAEITHDRPVEIGRQPGAEPRYFEGDMAAILLYNRTLDEAEQQSVGHWLARRWKTLPERQASQGQQ